MTEQGSTIGNAIDGRRNQLLQPSDVMRQLLADNGHAPLHGQEGAPPPEPVQHRIWTEDELREIDPQLHQFTDADRKLQRVYGDTVHANDESHLHGGID